MENTAPIVEKIMYDGITTLIKGTILLLVLSVAGRTAAEFELSWQSVIVISHISRRFVAGYAEAIRCLSSLCAVAVYFFCIFADRAP